MSLIYYNSVLAYLKKQRNYSHLLPQIVTYARMEGVTGKKLVHDLMRVKVPIRFIRKYVPPSYRMMLKNPRPILKQKYYRHAVQAAQWLYKHFKGNGVPSWMINRLSPKIRPIVVDILKYNGVKVREINPPKKTFGRL